MSGHSKWATTKRQKAVADAKKANAFTKLANSLAVATKEGGADPDTNFKLKIAIDRAKAANMPKNNIDRAIARASGKADDIQLEQLTYEGLGPEKIAVIIEAITDNRNRTVSNLKHAFNKHGGQLASNGSLLWMFDRRGVIVCTLKPTALNEELQLKMIEGGAEDWEQHQEKLIIYCQPNNLQSLNNHLQTLNLNIISSELEYLPKETIQIKEKDKWDSFLAELEQDDDIQNYYTNADG